MAFVDPFKNIQQVDSSNVLDIPIENLKEAKANSAQFKLAIEILIKIKEVLVAIRSAGTDISTVTGLDLFADALRWLHFEAPLSNIIAIPQISSYSDVDDKTAGDFHTYVSNMHTQYFLPNNPYNSMHNIVAALRETVDSTIKASRNKTKSEITALSIEQQAEINRITADSVKKIQQAQALAVWAAHYKTLVDEYRELVYGRQVIREKTVVDTDSEEEVLARIQNNHDIWGLLSVLKVRAGRIYQQFINSKQMNFLGYHLSSIVNRSRSFSGRRNSWFTLFALTLFTQATIFIYALLDEEFFGINLQNFIPQHGDTQLFIKLGIMTSIILPITLGYAFANKNYRIYANLYEQYRHREVVARTLQGIIIEIQENDKNADVRAKLTELAGKAMFDQKAIGHLTKRDSDHSPFAEIVQTVAPRS